MWEKGSMNVRSVQSFNRMFYTWENPTGSRTLVWEGKGKKDIEDNLKKVSFQCYLRTLFFSKTKKLLQHLWYLFQDNLGTIQVDDIDEDIYYVSFLDGTQRVLLFTTSLKIAEDCQLAGDLEVIDQDITISIHGLGFSLVNNINQVELLYMCIARFVSKNIYSLAFGTTMKSWWNLYYQQLWYYLGNSKNVWRTMARIGEPRGRSYWRRLPEILDCCANWTTATCQDNADA